MHANWIIQQRWKHVLFLHWRTDPGALQALVPFELDLFEGKAVVSIVPFRMEAIRFPFMPSLPGVSSLWELNLRTYVKVGGRSGIYFFTLDTDSRLGCWVANRFFHLPYRLAEMEGLVAQKRYDFASRRGAMSFRIGAELLGKTKEKSALDLWATERYRLFTQAGGRSYEGEVLHRAWPLEEVGALELQDSFSGMLPVKLENGPEAVSYAREINVRFRPFKALL